MWLPSFLTWTWNGEGCQINIPTALTPIKTPETRLIGDSVGPKSILKSFEVGHIFVLPDNEPGLR